MGFRDALETFSEEDQLRQLNEMSADECDALFDLLVAGALVDGKLDREEAEMLAEEFSHLPFFAAANTTLATTEYGFARRGELMDRISEGNDELLREIADRLTNQGHREAALRSLALVVEVGGVDEDELGFALEAAQTFGIEVDDALEMLRKAWDFNHPPFA